MHINRFRMVDFVRKNLKQNEILPKYIFLSFRKFCIFFFEGTLEFDERKIQRIA